MRVLEVLPGIAYAARHGEIASKTTDHQVGWGGNLRLAVLRLDRNILVGVRLPDFNSVDQPMGRVL